MAALKLRNGWPASLACLRRKQRMQHRLRRRKQGMQRVQMSAQRCM
jgi:hypothetical protein